MLDKFDFGVEIMEEEIKVSVCMLSYNHERFIAKAIDGVLSQKTNFKFELLIHDDASTDNSADIIREYEKKYPDIIKPIYQTENQYSQGVAIQRIYQYPRARGKYIAYCEGDDYWCDDNKLQKQFEALEQNGDCSICTAKVLDVDINGNKLKRFHPSFTLTDGVIDSRKAFEMMVCRGEYSFQTSSYLVRKTVLDEYCSQMPRFAQISRVGDRPLIFFCLTRGNMYYIDNTMSCYRQGSPYSWSRGLKNIEFHTNNCQNNIDVLNEFNKYTDYRYDEEIKTAVLIEKLNIYKRTINSGELKKLRRDITKLPSRLKRRYYIVMYFPFAVKLYYRLKGYEI